MSPGVLLTDAYERSAPAACLSLGRAGYRVGGASHRGPAPGKWSRHCDSGFVVSDPRSASSAFAEELSEIADAGAFTTLLPGSDASVIALSDHREAFSDAVKLGLPSKESVDLCVSKIAFHERAAKVGLAPPETVVCSDREAALAAARRLGLPVVLKPHRTVFSLAGTKHQRTSYIATDEPALELELEQVGFPCLLQRRESGGLVSVAGVMAGEDLLATAVSKYIRTWPADVGAVSYSETIAPTTDLVEAARDLLASLGWQGVFELECIEGADGGLAAIDFNPRLYGSLALAVSARAPLPAIWCDWLLKDRVVKLAAQPSLHYRWLDSDLRHTWQYVRKRRLTDAIAVLMPKRHTTHPYFRWSDPAPALARLLQMVRVGLVNRIKGLFAAARRA